MAMRPEEVHALVLARPWARRPWARKLVDAFPERLAAALARWELTVTGAHTDGAELPVLSVHGRSIGPAILKLGGHGSDLSQQVRLLRAADGRGYVRVLEEAEDLDAVLLEALGAPLHTSQPDPVAQSRALAALLPSTWELPAAVGAPHAPGQKAASLLALVEGALDGPEQVPGGADAELLERARSLALELRDHPAPTQAVLHGDPHSGNALRRGTEHVLIDPDGFLGEREYDAGVMLRDHQHRIDELDRTEGAGAGRRWQAELTVEISSRLELEPERVLAWAHLERVTTGLFLGRLGWHEESAAWLRTAGRILC